MVEVPEVHCVAGQGLKGDRFFGYKPDYKGQITFFAWETYQQIQKQFSQAPTSPSVLRRNVVTEGLDLMGWVGVEFELQGVRFFGTGECAPCEWMNLAVAPGAEAFLKGLGGLRARVLSDGILRCDSPPVS
ncbi:MAG: hypothetical protein RLZZ399_615 [Verrucomicrobiota bacterium]|jgi:MOSC domain-containing protein YiiM